MQTLSIIGVGALGEFIIPHLRPWFSLKLYDPYKSLTHLDHREVVNFETAIQSEIILLAIPLSMFENVTSLIAPYLKKGQLVIDVASVKTKPIDMMQKNLPAYVDIVSTHPIFGPQSGKNGIHGLNISVINVRGERQLCVMNFLRKLNLNIIETTAQEHDKQMAYVQGLTHLIAKIYKNMNVPSLNQTSKTYDLLQQMVDLIKNDSDDLFRAIQMDNPYVESVKKDFFEQVKIIEANLIR
jgi:prephenate dehydrogenase